MRKKTIVMLFMLSIAVFIEKSRYVVNKTRGLEREEKASEQ